MCGRYMLTLSNEVLEKYFGVPLPVKRSPNYNAAPTQMMPIITQENSKEAVLARWGLIPHWAQDPKIGYKMINARAETLAEKPSYRGLISAKKCLVLADSFIEWQKTKDGKQPYRIMLKSGEPFAFAGLYDVWKSPAGEVVTYTIITGEPNSVEAKVHDRAPVILPHDKEKKWLAASKDDALKMLTKYPAAQMKAYPISAMVNSPKVNDAKLMEEVGV